MRDKDDGVFNLHQKHSIVSTGAFFSNNYYDSYFTEMNNLLNLKLNLCVYRNGLNENYQHHNGQVEQMQLSDV